MIEISVKVPKDVRDIVTVAGDTIYIEALSQVAIRRMSYIQKQLDEIKKLSVFMSAKTTIPMKVLCRM